MGGDQFTMSLFACLDNVMMVVGMRYEVSRKWDGEICFFFFLPCV